MFDLLAKEYRKELQPYIKWDYDGFGKTVHGVCRIGKFKLNPVRDYIRLLDGGSHEFRPVTEKDTSSVPVTACIKGLRHLPYGTSLELYFGNMPEKDREKFRNAFPDAKEIFE